jgi:hypothetical protein
MVSNLAPSEALFAVPDTPAGMGLRQTLHSQAVELDPETILA